MIPRLASVKKQIVVPAVAKPSTRKALGNGGVAPKARSLIPRLGKGKVAVVVRKVHEKPSLIPRKAAVCVKEVPSSDTSTSKVRAPPSDMRFP